MYMYLNADVHGRLQVRTYMQCLASYLPIKSIMEVHLYMYKILLCLEWDLILFADVTCSYAQRFVIMRVAPQSKLHSGASDIHNSNLQHAM